MSVSTWVSWCIVEINTADLYFFGTYDTNVLFSWNANADDNSCQIRDNIGGGTVPTYVKTCRRSSSTSATLVKKLSPTKLRPLLYHGDITVVTTHSPWLTLSSRSCAGCLPRYTSAFRGYDVAPSQYHHTTFTPHLAGLLGMYCLKGQRPLNWTSCSTTVISVPGI